MMCCLKYLGRHVQSTGNMIWAYLGTLRSQARKQLISTMKNRRPGMFKLTSLSYSSEKIVIVDCLSTRAETTKTSGGWD